MARIGVMTRDRVLLGMVEARFTTHAVWLARVMYGPRVIVVLDVDDPVDVAAYGVAEAWANHLEAHACLQ